MAITRRPVLASLAAPGVVGSLGVGTVAWQWWDRPPGAGLKALSPDEFSFVEALADAWMPEGGEPSLSGSQAGRGSFMDELVAAMPASQAREMKLLLQVLDDVTLPMWMGRFQSLQPAQQQQVLARWMNSSNHLLRSGVTAVIALLASGYTMHPEIAATVQQWYRCGYGR